MRRSVLTLLPLLLASCGEIPAPAPVVQLKQMRFDDLFEQVGEISVQADDSLPLINIVGVDADSRGRLIVSDISEANVHLFDEHGERLAVFGRRGSGPGEFKYPLYPRFYGDSLIHVFDTGHRQVIQYADSDTFVGQVSIPSIAPITDVQVLAGGNFLIAGRSIDPDDEHVLFEVDSGGNVLHRHLPIRNATFEGAGDSHVWDSFRSFYFTVERDTAYVVSTISDHVWTVALSTGAIQRIRLDIPGYVPPEPLPGHGFPTTIAMRDFAMSFHRAEHPTAVDGTIVIPFVRGALMEGDLPMLAVRTRKGEWAYVSEGPAVRSRYPGGLLSLENPMAMNEPFRFGIYRGKR